MELLDWWREIAFAVAAIAAALWLTYLHQRVNDLEAEKKNQAYVNKDLRYRLEKLEREACNMDNFARGLHPQWHYDALRKWIANEVPSDLPPLNDS
jgi:hypothetical protein